MTANNYIQNAFETAYVSDEQYINAMENQIQTLKDKIRRKRIVQKKRTPEIYEDSVRNFMQQFLMKSKEEQRAILASFKEECVVEKPSRRQKVQDKPINTAETDETTNNDEVIELKMTKEEVVLAEKPDEMLSKPKKGRSSKKKSKKDDETEHVNVVVDNEIAKEEPVAPVLHIPEDSQDEDFNDDEEIPLLDDDETFDEKQYSTIKSKPATPEVKALLESSSDTPTTPDLCEKDVVTDAGMCFISKKDEIDDDEYRNIVLPIISERIYVNDYNESEGGTLHVFGHDFTDIRINSTEYEALRWLLLLGSYGLKQIAKNIFCPFEQSVDDEDPRVRHDLLVVAVESLRKKLYKATNGAIQIEYYIFRNMYPYDDFVPYDAVSIRLRKAGPFNSLQEKNYQSLYESAKKSYSGS